MALRDPRIRADEATIARSLQGHWRDEHIFELTQELYRCTRAIAECDREIEAHGLRIAAMANRLAASPTGRKTQKNAPDFDVRSHLYRVT